MKKGLKIIGVVLIFIVIMLIGAFIWVDGLMKDQAKTKKTMKVVLKSYDNFNNRVEEFSDIRNKFYELKEELYLETLSQNVDGWNDFMNKYAENIKEVEKASKNLKNNCFIKYGDVETNSKCTAFKANYEAAMNYYITDVKVYNKLVDEYDKWNEEQGGENAKLNKADYPVYKKYIDFDKDGEYFGKEEVENNE